ncbi:MAG: V-type ATPase 116kDa subunit family protein [Oscillospiraceae bacterium]
MAIERMKLMKISGNLDKLTELSAKLCECECFEPDSASKFISSSMGFVPFVEDNPYAAQLQELTEIAKAAEFPLDLQSLEREASVDEEDSSYIKMVEKTVIDLYEERSSLIHQKNICEAGIEKFSHFKGLQVDLDQISNCEFLQVRFGHLPKESYVKINTTFKDNPYVLFYPCSEDKTDYWGAYFAPRDRLNEIDGIFAFLLFEPFEIPGAAGTVNEVLDECNNSINIISSQLGEVEDRLKAFWALEKDHCNLIYTNLVYANSIFELRSFALHNDKFFMFTGYVPSVDEHKVVEIIDLIDGISLESTDAPEDGKTIVPVKLKKTMKPFNFLVDPYRFYVDMYGTPAYTDIDVTGFVAITYTILFGMMFGDMGQGLVLAIAGFLMWKFKKMGLGKILVPCGISSMFFGFMFGSVFGYEEMLNPIYKAIGWSGKPLPVMESVNTVLLIAIGIGVGLMVMAMLLNMYALIRRKKFGEAIFSQNGFVGLLMYLAGANFASGFMGGPAPISNAASGIILALTAVLLLIKEIPIGIIDHHADWKPESIMDFLLQNVFELLEYILSYLSNTVSFLRVGAFVLVHAGMMMVVFSLAGESENIFVIILGNILVICLEGLLTGIQALRLEYYEMFSRFYEGGGREFIPARLKRAKAV